MKNKHLSFFLVLVLAIAAALVIAMAAGENPLVVGRVLLNGAFGSVTNFGYTLYYATPLIFTGLSVAWALRAGLFNVGGEGQMTLAGVAMAAVGIYLPLPFYLAVPFALLVGAIVGGVWAGVAGYLKAFRGVHEVLTTILLNFIAYGIAGFFISIVLRNPESQVPESGVIFESYWLLEWTSFGGGSPLNTSFVIAILFALLYGFLDSKSKFGFRQRLVGEAQGLARQTGTRVSKHIVLSMLLAGAFAGLGAINEVLGYLHKTKEGFTAGAGFVGIAVALLGRGRWYGIILASVLFGAIHKGSLDLDIDTENISRDFALVLQGVIILFVSAEAAFHRERQNV